MIRTGNVVPFAQNAEFFLRRGDARMESGVPADALAFYKKAIELSPTEPSAHLRLGIAYADAGCEKLAIPQLCEAMWRGSYDDPNLFFRLALLYMDGHEYEAAIICFREMNRIAEKLGDDCPEIGPVFSEALSRHLSEEENLKSSLSEEARKKIAEQSLKAMEELDRGNIKKAIALFERAWALAPDSIEQASNLAMACYVDKQYARALTVCNSALLRDRDNYMLRCILALIYHATGDEASLNREVEYLSAISGSDRFERIKLGSTLFEVDRPESALKHFLTILETAPCDTEVLHMAAVCHYNLGNIDEAKKLWERALFLDPKDPVFIYYTELCDKQAMDIYEPVVTCARELPLAEMLRLSAAIAEMQSESAEQRSAHPEIEQAIEWALRSSNWHIAGLNILLTHDPERAERELRTRLCDARVPADIKQTYLGMLSLLGAEGPFTAMMDCGVAEVTINVFNGLDQLHPNYRKVPELFVSKASERGGTEELIHEGVAIWRQFVTAVVDHPVTITDARVPAFAAALEYSAKRALGERVTQIEMIEVYGATISRFRTANRLIYDLVFSGAWEEHFD
ncbi:MAG: tetratricopeptide repeat protein [Christensenellales bacterium]|jgi:tetratricopeptide (TPR) repeat protein